VPVRHLARGVAVLGLAAILALAGCDRRVDGHAAVGKRDADPAYFFGGDVSLFEQTVSANDKTALAYLRALRRIDVCGLLNHEALAKVGEILALATFFAFDECDVDIKVTGAPAPSFASVELTMTSQPGIPVAVRAGDTPIYRSYPGSCEYLVPLQLDKLPGARPLRKPQQPFVRVGLIGADDCGIALRITDAIAQRLLTAPPPARDGAAVYPSALAERDPCEVLPLVGDDVDHWDIGSTQPYECQFEMWRTGDPDVLSMRVQLRPELVENVTDGRERQQRDGVEMYVDHAFCSAVSFVGAPMQRRIIGGGYVDLAHSVVRPAVVAETGGKNCDAVVDVATRAAKLYG
jgi:hypothetical protein